MSDKGLHEIMKAQREANEMKSSDTQDLANLVYISDSEGNSGL